MHGDREVVECSGSFPRVEPVSAERSRCILVSGPFHPVPIEHPYPLFFARRAWSPYLITVSQACTRCTRVWGSVGDRRDDE